MVACDLIHLGYVMNVMPNWSVNADAQSRPAAAQRLSLGAGYVQR